MDSVDILMVIDKKDKKKFIKKAEEIKNVFEKQNLEMVGVVK